MSSSNPKELKSPFIDTITSDDGLSTILSGLILKSSQDTTHQAEHIKEAMDEITNYLISVSPSLFKVGHSIISSIFYESRDKLVCLTIDGLILKYLLKDKEITKQRLRSKLERIYKSADDAFFIGISSKTLLVMNSESLSVVKEVRIDGIISSCRYLDHEQIVLTNSKFLVLNLKNTELNEKFELNGIYIVNFIKKDIWIAIDNDSVKLINKKLIPTKQVPIKGIKTCHISELKTEIVLKLSQKVLILNLNLEIISELNLGLETTDLVYNEKSKIIIFSTAKGEVIFCDMGIPERKVPNKIHKSSITNIFLKHNKIISLSNDMQIGLSTMPKLKNCFSISTNVVSISLSQSSFLIFYLTKSSEIFSWDYKENLTNLLFKSENELSGLLYHNEYLYFNSECLLQSLHLPTNKITFQEKRHNILHPSLFLISPDLLAGIGQSNTIYLFSLKSLEEISELTGHSQRVTCFNSYKRVAVSGSADKSVKVWNIQDQVLIHTLTRHEKAISSVFVLKGKIFSASQDRTIKIWYVKTGELIHSINGVSGVVNFIEILNNEFLLTCNNFGTLTYWSLATYEKIIFNSLYGPVSCFKANDDTILYSSYNRLVAFVNPLKGKKLVITGPKEKDQFKAYKYYKKLLCGKTPKFNSVCDKWVVFPYLLTPLHLYAYFNLPGHISESISGNSSLVQSRLKQSPLSIAVSRDLETCVSNIIQLIKPKLALNPYLLNFIDDQCLIEMNQTGHDSLALFYKVFFQDVASDNLPRFIKHEVQLPIYAKSLSMIPRSEAFIQDSKKSDIGQAVVFIRSLGKLSLAMGSKDSIKLLRSIVECKNYEIFNTPFIRAYIQHKWESVKPFMWVQFLIYFSYLVYFGLYLMQIYSNTIFLIIPLMLSCIMTLYEIYKAAVSFSEYFIELWNYIDAARAILFLIFFYQQWNDNKDSSIDDISDVDYVLLFLVLSSFVKGLSYFRLFTHTRYFTHLLYKVLIDSYAFVVILVYNTVAFGFIMLVVFKFDNSFTYYLGQAFEINLAFNDPSDYTTTQWAVYVFGIAINCWVMMSVLISIYGETFDNVLEVADIENTRTLAVMSLEAERNIFWQRGLKNKSYLHMCTNSRWRSEVDPALSKIKDLKKLVKESRSDIETMKFEILEALRKQNTKKRRKDKSKNQKESALKIFRVLIHEFGSNNLEKNEKVKKINKIIKSMI